MPVLYRVVVQLVAVLAAFLVEPVANAQVPTLKASRIAEFGDGLSRPHDAALSPDGRLLYVTDMQNSRIVVLEAMSLKPVGSFGERELAHPHDAAFDAAGRLLVADTGNNRIATYEVKAAEAKLSGEIRDLAGTEGVAVLPDGRVVASSTRRATLSLIRDGRIERSAGRYGKADGELANPHDVEVDAEGRIHVVDSGNNRIQVFDAQLKHLATTPPTLGLNGPKYLAFDGATAWLADEYNHRILRLDGALKPTGVLGGRSGRAADAFNQPEAVVARAPYLWVIDTYNDRIVLLKVD